MLIRKILITLYLLTGFVPTFLSVDRSATQIVFIQGLNLVAIGYLVFNYKRIEIKDSLLKTLKSPFTTSLFLFIIWCAITIIKSVNIGESLRTLTEILSYLIAFIIILSLIRLEKNRINFISTILVLVLSVEIIYILYPFLNDLYLGQYVIGARSYKGTTGNINIAAFSITLKLPFLFYKILTSKKINYLYLLLYIISIFIIQNLHQTRGAFIANFIVIITLIGFVLFLKFSKIKNTQISMNRLLVVIATFILALGLNKGISVIQNNNSSLYEKIGQIGSEDSSRDRLRYYSEALTTFIENPLFGIGIGQWELKSIDTHGKFIKGYVVPYHTHNDYLELLAETGIIGVLLFYGVIFFVFIRLVILILKSLEINQSQIFVFCLLLAIGVYLLDALFNFPFARPIQQIGLLFILSLGILTLEDNSLLKRWSFVLPSKLIVTSLLIASPFVMYSSIRVFNAYQQHYYLLGQFNQNKYIQEIELVETYEDKYPSVMATTIPIKTMKGLFHLRKNNDYKKALDYFRQGREANPYLKINETFMGYCYYYLKQKDSAYYYTKEAFDKIPNNPIHFAHYLMMLGEKKDTMAIKRAREKVTLIGDEIVDEIYYLAMAGLLDKDEGNIALSNASKELLNSKNDKLKTHIYVLELGKEKVFGAGALNYVAEEHFKNKEFLKAAEMFEEAAKLNNLESSYFENAANAYMKVEKYDKALEMVNYTLNNIEENNPKALFMKGLLMYQKEKFNDACLLFNKAKGLGYNISYDFIRVGCSKAK